MIRSNTPCFHCKFKNRRVTSRQRLQNAQCVRSTPERHQRVAAAAYNLWRVWTFQPTHRTTNQPSEHANAALSCFNKSRQKTRCIPQISPAPIRYPSQPLHTRLCQVGTFGTIILGKNALAVITPLRYTSIHGLSNNTTTLGKKA